MRYNVIGLFGYRHFYGFDQKINDRACDVPNVEEAPGNLLSKGK